jgi:hypothetical protein
MSCRGVHFAITDEDLGRLLAAQSDNQIRELISDGIEERWDEAEVASRRQARSALVRIKPLAKPSTNPSKSCRFRI